MHSSFIYFEDQHADSRRLYQNPLRLIKADNKAELAAAFKDIERCKQDGHYLAGWFSYELGYLLDPVLEPLLHKEHSGPFLCLGVFKGFETTPLYKQPAAYPGKLASGFSRTEYTKRFDRIRRYIRAGDVYQINLSFPLHAEFSGSPLALYQSLKAQQPVRYGCAAQMGGMALVSLSPELFFETRGHNIFMRPMKGTIRRGENEAEDRALARFLRADPKNRAENLMIVDLLRNDLSRIARPSSVRVTDLFSVETLPSLHTMTSGIGAVLRPDIKLVDILTALFPCGSITGAPKIRAMEIIRELETNPRGSYCGAIGWIDPNGDMRLNVAIRTMTLQNGQLVYPVGSGVVFDSNASDEYEECLLKAKALARPDFQLIETLGWDTLCRFMHLDLHLARLKTSAKALGFHYDPLHIRAALQRSVQGKASPHRVRLLLGRNGNAQVSTHPMRFNSPDHVWPVALSKNRLCSTDPYLRYKTTQRHFYDDELLRLQAHTNCREALFINESGEICEGSFTNVFIKKPGGTILLTPPVTSGLLPGILRQVLLSTKQAQEQLLYLDDILTADELWVGNSLRGLQRARLVSPTPQ